MPRLHLVLIFLTMLPATMVVPVFKEIIKDRLAGDNIQVGFFVSIAMLGSFLFGPIAGYLSDRYQNRKTLIAIGAALNAVCFFTLTLATSLDVLLFVRFLEGATSIAVISLLLAHLSDLENDPGQTRFYHKGILLGLGGMLLSLGVGLGLPLGILGRGNPLLPFYVAASLMLLIGIAALFLKDAPRLHATGVDLSRVRRIISGDPLLLIPLAFAFIDRFTVGFLVTSFNLHLRETIELGPGLAGAFLGLVLLPMALLSPLAAWLARRIGLLLPVALGSVVYGCCLFLAGTMITPFSIGSLLLLAGFGAGMMFVPSLMLASRLAPNAYRADALVISAFMSAGSLGFMLGPLFSVFIQDRFFASEADFGTLAFIFGLLEILIVLAMLPFAGRLKDRLSVS